MTMINNPRDDDYDEDVEDDDHGVDRY